MAAGTGGRAAGPAAAKPVETEELVDRFLHRPLAALLVPLLARTPLTPNQVTLLSGAVGVLGGVALGWGADRPAGRLLGGALLFVSVILDCCDGQLARVRGTSSTTGAVLDGIADYAVGIAFTLGGSLALARGCGSPWLWLLGIGGMACAGLQAALFDHAKTRYIEQVADGYAEREADLGAVARNRAAARAAGRRGEAFLLGVYERYSRAQMSAVPLAPVADPAAHRAAHRGRMFAWTFLGSGTHLAFAYLAAALSTLSLAALAAFFVLNLTVGNLYLAVLLQLERSRRPEPA